MWLVEIAGFLYAVSMHKFAIRDPLSTSTGIQGVIEVFGIVLPFLLILTATWRAKRISGASPVLVCFFTFAVFALASSWRSFSPSFSFVKGSLLLVVLATGYLLGQTGLGQRYFRSIYQSYAILIAIGLVVGLLLPQYYPLLSVDDYSGRTRMSVFATFPGVLGEDAALLLIIGPLIRLKVHWLYPAFLFVIVVLAGGKMSTALLCLAIVIRFMSQTREWRSWRTVVTISAVLLCVTFAAVSFLDTFGHDQPLVRLSQSIYGTQVSAEAKGMDGRLDLWAKGISLLGDAQVLGYGIDGDRAAMLKVATWSGSSHSGYLELAIAAGTLAFFVLLLGFAWMVASTLAAHPAVRLDFVLPLAYILISALVGGGLKAPAYIGFLTILWLSYELRACSLCENSVNVMPEYPLRRPNAMRGCDAY